MSTEQTPDPLAEALRLLVKHEINLVFHKSQRVVQANEFIQALDSKLYTDYPEQPVVVVINEAANKISKDRNGNTSSNNIR